MHQAAQHTTTQQQMLPCMSHTVQRAPWGLSNCDHAACTALMLHSTPTFPACPSSSCCLTGTQWWHWGGLHRQDRVAAAGTADSSQTAVCASLLLLHMLTSAVQWYARSQQPSAIHAGTGPPARDMVCCCACHSVLDKAPSGKACFHCVCSCRCVAAGCVHCTALITHFPPADDRLAAPAHSHSHHRHNPGFQAHRCWSLRLDLGG